MVWQPGESAWLPIAIFLARLTDVSMGTVRLICIMRGKRTLAVALSFVEIMIWLFAVSAVITRVDRWLNMVAYAGGFAAGTALGMWIENSLAMGTQLVSLISRSRAHAVAERLRFADMAVTTLTGEGRSGPVSVCMAIVPRRKTSGVMTMAREIDPDVVAAVADIVGGTAARAPEACPRGRTAPRRG